MWVHYSHFKHTLDNKIWMFEKVLFDIITNDVKSIVIVYNPRCNQGWDRLSIYSSSSKSGDKFINYSPIMKVEYEYIWHSWL